MLLTRGRYQFLAVVAIAASCEYQVMASTLCVKVNDYSDLPLRNALVNILNLKTNKLANARSDSGGRACISQLPEGLYSVEVGMIGFLNVRYYPVRVKYPAVHDLQFWLPLGEITEGLLSEEATVTGTLKQGNAPVGDVTICIFKPKTADVPLTCGTTNDLGEYAFSLTPGIYSVEIRMRGGARHRSKIDVSTSGSYRNLIVIDAPTEKDQ